MQRIQNKKKITKEDDFNQALRFLGSQILTECGEAIRRVVPLEVVPDGNDIYASVDFVVFTRSQFSTLCMLVKQERMEDIRKFLIDPTSVTVDPGFDIDYINEL